MSNLIIRNRHKNIAMKTRFTIRKIMKAFFQSILSAIKWVAGFFQDGKHSASSKRATLYIALWMLYKIVEASISGIYADNAMNKNILWGVILIILFGVGAVTTELVTKIFDNKFNKPE